MFIGVVVFAALVVLLLVAGAVYECARDKRGEILTDYAHGRIAATALGGLVLWAFALALVFVPAAALICRYHYEGRSVLGVAVDLAFDYRLYALHPVWTAPVLVAAGIFFAPLLAAAVFGLPIYRSAYKGPDGDYCAAEIDAPEDEGFCCFFAPFKRRARRNSSSSSKQAAPATAPRKFASPGVLLDYCFTVFVVHFCATCARCQTAPMGDERYKVWPWWAAFGCSFVAALVCSLLLNHWLLLLEMPSERTRQQRRQRWRTARGIASARDIDKRIEEEFGIFDVEDLGYAGGTENARPQYIELRHVGQMGTTSTDDEHESEQQTKRRKKPRGTAPVAAAAATSSSKAAKAPRMPRGAGVRVPRKPSISLTSLGMPTATTTASTAPSTNSLSTSMSASSTSSSSSTSSYSTSSVSSSSFSSSLSSSF